MGKEFGGEKKGRREKREERREGREKEAGKESRRKENFCTSSICKESERPRATKQHIPLYLSQDKATYSSMIKMLIYLEFNFSEQKKKVASCK